MSKGSKDHFVPCGYLRHFAIEDSKTRNSDYRKWRVHAYNRVKSEEIRVPVSIDSVANSKFFEHFEGNEKLNEEIKAVIRIVENSFFPVQSEIVLKKTLLGRTEKILSVMDFVAFQRERTQFRRNLYKTRLQRAINKDSSTQELSEMGNQKTQKVISALLELRELLKARLQLSVPPDVRDSILENFEQALSRVREDAVSGKLQERLAKHLSKISEEDAALRNFHLSNSFKFAHEFSIQMRNCSWVMFRNKTKQPFWTSWNWSSSTDTRSIKLSG